MFGKSADKPYLKPLQVWELFGCAVHHASRARFCIERGWYWQAEYWISAIRHYVFTLHVFAETYQHLKEEVSMISHQKSIKFSIEHS